MIQFRADTRKLQTLIRRLGGNLKRAKSGQRRLAQDIADALQKLAERRIRTTKADPDGVPWRPWSNSYAATRGGSDSLLMDTRELLNSFEATATPGGQFAKLTNTAPHAGYVQKERPFMGIGRAEEREIEDIAERWLERLL